MKKILITLSVASMAFLTGCVGPGYYTEDYHYYYHEGYDRPHNTYYYYDYHDSHGIRRPLPHPIKPKKPEPRKPVPKKVVKVQAPKRVINQKAHSKPVPSKTANKDIKQSKNIKRNAPMPPKKRIVKSSNKQSNAQHHQPERRQ